MEQKIKLSKKQEEIVFSEEEAICVMASAGSGKTRILTERIRYLLTKTRRKILALTFTNKAAEEMKNRLSEIPDINNRTFIGTIHSFCQTVLENHGNLIGLEKMPHIFEDNNDRLKLLEQAIEETPIFWNQYKNKNYKEKKELLYRVLEFISKVKREIISEENFLKNTDEKIVILYNTYQNILMSQNAIDFDDLFLLVCNLFNSYPKIGALYRRSYEYICIDEAQDLNNAQYQVLLSLTAKEHRKIMIVGHPDQAIFAFVGSTADFMTKKFIDDFNAKIFKLQENYRSSKKVLEVAEKIIPCLSNLKETVIEGEFELKRLPNEKLEAEWIIKKIKELLVQKNYDDIEGEVTLEKISILARNKYVFKNIEEELKEKKIKYYYKMTPGAIKFESKLIKIFDLALKIKLNPKDVIHFESILNLLDIKKGEYFDLKNVISIIENDLEREILELVNTLSEDGSNLIQKLNLLEENIKKSNLIDDEEKQMIINDILEIKTHWNNYAKNSERRTLNQFKNRMALGQTNSLSQHSGITLSTVHTMKGQEYDIVFLIGMDDGTFPDYRAIRKGGIELEQEKNITYVAVTRSKRFLYITYPENRNMPWGNSISRNISRFLNGIF